LPSALNGGTEDDILVSDSLALDSDDPAPELLAIRAERIVPLLDAIVAGEAQYHAGEQALDVMWRMRDGRALHLAVRLMPDAPPGHARDDVIWKSRPDDAWTVRWSVGHD